MYRHKNSWRLGLKYPPSSKEETQVPKTLISGLPGRKSSSRVGEKLQSAHKMPLPPGLLLLLLSGATATAALPLEGGPTGRDSEHMQEAAGIRKSSLLTFLAWWFEWTSQASAGPLIGEEAREVARRQEGAPPQQSARRDRMPCRNFFWKTFSSCK
nr:LOW QUALITY PROTEIN: cortistatin [Pan paniscus]